MIKVVKAMIEMKFYRDDEYVYINISDNEDYVHVRQYTDIAYGG
jgi:hypothetical protein